LGAEKALFRALKTKGNTPKYGLIFHSSFIGRAGAKNKGRISRYLANKCAIAARIDSFSEVPNSKYGEKLKEQVEDRLTFYDSGATPKKNIDCMREAAAEVALLEGESEPKSEKKDKKKRKRDEEDEEEEQVEEKTPKKSKKEKKEKISSKDTEEKQKKKKKKKDE